jgi:hypothetical protein
MKVSKKWRKCVSDAGLEYWERVPMFKNNKRVHSFVFKTGGQHKYRITAVCGRKQQNGGRGQNYKLLTHAIAAVEKMAISML